ncbi:aconitate hydratase AcnA [Rhodococcus opacus]|uniref:aconitate hydratase AcnA n=1 Tax=Rhodococcus opacus TaxID=37919 RepID=UPI00155B0EB5|nr:aconitate hydratase AcnA [Rhodococcus opacus]
MTATTHNSFDAMSYFEVGTSSYQIYRLKAVPGVERLPYALKVLAENLLRNENGTTITADQIRAIATWDPHAEPATEIQFTPARVLMQDFTGVPCIVDLATMREAVVTLGGSPGRVNPRTPTELVIDHSVMVEFAGRADAMERNAAIEYSRNRERYTFLRWGQGAFDDFKVVPPGTGIVHQVNIEHLARGVMVRDGQAYPDTCVGTDSHTTMVNGLGILGWGVGGIEAEAVILGQPISMLLPRVLGFKLSGEIQPGVTATDVVLTVTEMLRAHGVVGKIVEFYGEGVAEVPLANRATLGNMSPEFGSTAAIFPIDQETIDYLRLTGRSAGHISLVEGYAKEQGLWHDPSVVPEYSEYLELDLGEVIPSIAGPRRPQDRIPLASAKAAFRREIGNYVPSAGTDTSDGRPSKSVTVVSDGHGEVTLEHGAVVIASITSCTNTSNPSVMLSAALLARNAVAKGLSVKPWVTTSLAPGSRAVTDYYHRAGLWPYLEQLGFHLVGYGCALCVGNAGPLAVATSRAIQDNDLAVAAVLSGNRNFEGRISPDVKMNYLASPPLVIAYALTGTMDFDFEHDALGTDSNGAAVYLRDIWPTASEVEQTITSSVTPDLFVGNYADVFAGDERWQTLPGPVGHLFDWDRGSTYVRRPPYFDDMPREPLEVSDIRGARVLALLGDSVTTDHISPAGTINPGTPAAQYLEARGVQRRDFNSYGSRRGNHEVMVRGTFANIRLRNQLLDDVLGGYTRDFTKDDAPQSFIYDASQNYQRAGIPLLVLGGKEYGTGSSRDWAAKGTNLLGVKAVLAESFERIHRSNLIGMGVVPLQHLPGSSAYSLGLDGSEVYDIEGLEVLNEGHTPSTVTVTASRDNGQRVVFRAVVRIDTPSEAEYYRHGGILHYALRTMLGDQDST